jgi:Flp pilus assembly protein TadD
MISSGAPGEAGGRLAMAETRMAALEQMLAADPTDTTAHYMLGLEYFKAQMYAEAVATLRHYLTLVEDEGAAYRTLAHSLERLGRPDEAREAYRHGLDAATRHGHQPLIEEYTHALRDLA